MDETPPCHSNYFEEVEQSSFKPSEMIPGIEPSADVLLQGRLFAYADTAVHRLGRNNRNIPINKPKVDVHNYSRFGYFAMGMENPVSCWFDKALALAYTYTVWRRQMDRAHSWMYTMTVCRSRATTRTAITGPSHASARGTRIV